MLESLIGLHIKANKKMTDDKLNLIPLSLKETIQNVLNIYKDDGAFIKTSLKNAKKNNICYVIVTSFIKQILTIFYY